MQTSERDGAAVEAHGLTAAENVGRAAAINEPNRPPLCRLTAAEISTAVEHLPLPLAMGVVRLVKKRWLSGDELELLRWLVALGRDTAADPERVVVVRQCTREEFSAGLDEVVRIATGKRLAEHPPPSEEEQRAIDGGVARLMRTGRRVRQRNRKAARAAARRWARERCERRIRRPSGARPRRRRAASRSSARSGDSGSDGSPGDPACAIARRRRWQARSRSGNR